VHNPLARDVIELDAELEAELVELFVRCEGGEKEGGKE
jgi:hypothetical protein